MTEAEWLACADTGPMLWFLRGKASDRKLRLFAVECCRRIDLLITDPRSRAAVSFAQAHADEGIRGRRGVTAAREGAATAKREAAGMRAFCAASAAEAAVGDDAWEAATYAGMHSSAAAAWAALGGPGDDPNRTTTLPVSLQLPEIRLRADILHCLIGNHFRPVARKPSWLTADVTSLARQMYVSRDLSPMPILADALQDAGCDNVDILNHCREPGPHARGCWVVDLLLGGE